MSKLDQIIARLRALPEAEAEALAHEIEALMARDETCEVDDEDLARVERELNEPTRLIPHEDVMARLERRYLK